MADQGVDKVANELYAVDPTQFVAARTAAVRRAHETGHRDVATAIGRLRRPTTSAWAVNLLARSAGVELAELLALGEELRAAQQGLQGDQLRRLSQRRREVVGALTRRARQLAADAGHPLGAAASAEVEQTLIAALADPELGEAVRVGQLARPLQHVGLGPEPLLMAPPRPRTERRSSPSRSPSSSRSPSPSPSPSLAASSAPSPSASPAPSAQDESAQGEMARRRRRHQERVARKLERASQELDDATRRAERAEQRVREATERSADAERRLSEVRQEWDQADRERADAQRCARSAARVRDEAERRLQRLAEERQAAR